MNNRGSEWRKWDLHIHTPFSIEQEYSGYTDENWEKFISDLERLPSEIKVIGINDYIFIDGYKKVLEEKRKGRLNNINLILPVIELRIDKFANTSVDNPLRRVNFHIIFSNELTPEQIEAQFLNSLSAEYKIDPEYEGDFDWGGVITRENLIDLGEKLIQSSNGKLSGSPLKIGFNSLNIPYERLLEKLKNNPILRNKFLTAVGKTEWDTMRWDGSPAEKKNVINKANFVFSASSSVELALSAKRSLKDQYVNSNLLHCSDAHRFINDLQNTKEKELGHCFTWIKADPTFEGLKQIIYEPEERVKIQDEKPDFKEDKEIIDKVKFISPANKFSNKEIYLNPNLNVIIGGKSSGKSILLYSIAKTLLADTKDKLLFKNNGEKRYSLDSIEPNFDFEVTTKAGIVQKISDRENGNHSIIPNIKYIPQNELVKLAEPELNGKGESLNKLVRNLICEDADSKQKYDDILIKNVKEYDKNREELIDNYFNTLDEITKLEGELKTKSNKEVLETNIKTNSDKVEELNKKAGLTEEQIQQYNTVQEKQLRNQQRRDLLNSDFRKTNDFLQELKRELVNLQNRKNAFLQNIQTSKFREFYQNKLSFIDESISQLETLAKEIELTQDDKGNNTFVKENIFSNDLNQISSEKQSIEVELKPYQQNEEIQKQIRTLNESITNDKKLLSEIDILNKNITEKKEFVIKIKGYLFQLYKKSFDEYTNIIELLKKRTSQLEKDGLQIKGIAQFNFPKFRDNVLGFTDGRSASNLNYDILKGDKTRISEYEYSDLENEVKNIFEDILIGKYATNTKYNQRQIMKKLLDDYFYDYWEITYKNDKLGEMSTGKASFVILMLIIGLSKSKSPILIDQPEDNLDNRSVSENIISYLRNKKIERQIILVTHNANIVVNADAENVIVANQKGQNDKDTTSLYKFDYINGAIENTFAKIEAETDLLKSMGIKEHIADIVEGGKEAFKNREKKYGFN
ncbi:hypothetical protein CGC56_02040 [Capnocytophaga canimorsus]|uniref:ATPase involved in DNA repair n=1 Tax=Capnocytophaga canimorsus TaxID=28188 RepID=A0A250G2S3_9FLAO|nr:hypothetical protein [Capnocytophaga canimorsus]ATA91055.1 hypothetical protein CGC56_02040 [Capnocytophaga canimorsus]